MRVGEWFSKQVLGRHADLGAVHPPWTHPVQRHRRAPTESEEVDNGGICYIDRRFSLWVFHHGHAPPHDSVLRVDSQAMEE